MYEEKDMSFIGLCICKGHSDYSDISISFKYNRNQTKCQLHKCNVRTNKTNDAESG